MNRMSEAEAKRYGLRFLAVPGAPPEQEQRPEPTDRQGRALLGLKLGPWRWADGAYRGV